MLLPDLLRDLSAFEGRPLWSVVEDGVVRHCRGDERRLAALRRCSVVVARRRHDRWHGPVAGFAVADSLRRAWLVELIDVDLCPWADEDSAGIFDWGLVALLEYARTFGIDGPKHRSRRPALHGILVPEGLEGPHLRQWLTGRDDGR